RARRAALEILLQPLELLRTELAKAACLQVQHVHERDEVRTVGIEAVPAPIRTTVELREEGATVIVDHVVLAREVMHGLADALDDFSGGIELLRLGQLAHVAGMHYKGRLHRERAYLIDGRLQCDLRSWVRLLAESDVAIADLHEAQSTS